ncbi:MAG: ABC transporter ATP-binding protein, partial [Caulobacteraceae bacterium]|nr:ABC transporter ATP-binding protein [Caulobacter sp.]
TAFSPDVLLMDEWLMAGDMEFHARADRRASGFVQKARIVVLASHASGLIRSFCTHAAYLRGGYLVDYGPANEIIDQYEADARRLEAAA